MQPRSSLLHLFDPLASPRRNAPSPDSDKENSSPIQFSFFSSANNPCPLPVKLTHRLIDVGDITVQDHSTHLLLDDDDEPDAFSNDENDSSSVSCSATPTPRFRLTTDAPSSISPRTPFSELPLKDDITPMARSKTYRRSPLSPSSLSDTEHVLSPSNGILSVIHEDNPSGISFASKSPEPCFLPLPHDTNNTAPEPLLGGAFPPHIIISSADSSRNSVATLNIEAASDTLLTETTRPFDNTPPSPPSEDTSQLLPKLRPATSSRDTSRHSIDLYSALQLHLQSEESSFDLLNDRVSFFGPGSDAESFFGDDSFDMGIEEANMEKALEKIRSDEKAVKLSTPSRGIVPAAADFLLANNGQQNTPPNFAANTEKASPGIAPDSGRKSLLKRFSLSSTPSPKTHSPKALSVGSPASPSTIPVFVAPPTRVQPRAPRASIYTPRPSSRGASFNPPPAVPALKIVKRAKRFDHDTSSSGSARSSASSPVGSAPIAAPTESKGRRSDSVSPTDHETRKEGSSVVASSTSRTVRAAGQSRAATGAQTVAVIRQTGTGPRRVPVTEGQASTASSTGNSGSQRGLPAGGVIGPKRVPLVAATKISTTAPVQARVPVASGLKQPSTRYGAGSASALPRPIISKLPSSNSNKMRTGEAIGNVGGAKSSGVRRMMFSGK